MVPCERTKKTVSETGVKSDPAFCLGPSIEKTNSDSTVVPGFRALGPSTTLCALNPGSALNPGTILLSYKEIVFKLKVDLNNPIFFP